MGNHIPLQHIELQGGDIMRKHLTNYKHPLVDQTEYLTYSLDQLVVNVWSVSTRAQASAISFELNLSTTAF